MFRDRSYAMSRWATLSLLLSLSFLSGMLDSPSSSQKTLIAYVTPAPEMTTAGQGSGSLSGKARYFPPQMQVLGVGEKASEQTSAAVKQQQRGDWGVATQVDEHTWTMQVGDDDRMATPQEIVTALNTYRQKHGKGSLTWDDGLASYAQQRAVYFLSIKKLDGHAGFTDFVNTQDGFHKLGFGGLGENSSYGYQLEGVHLIEWVYAGDKPHNDNQLDSNWSHVGIGVSGTATDLIFGGNKF